MEKSQPMNIPWLLGVYVALLVLLVLTIIAAFFPLGPLTLVISLLIAAAKASLVVLYFMHVRFASHRTWLFVGAGLLWLSILFTLTFGEYLGRRDFSRTFPAWTQEKPAPIGPLSTPATPH